MLLGKAACLNVSHELIVASNLSLTPCFQPKRRRKTVSIGFCALSQTAEAVRTPPPPCYTPLKRGVNEMNPLGMDCLKHSGWRENSSMV
jgi:hypothetical protein